MSPERKNLILHAVLLLRTVNRYQTKEEQLEEFSNNLTDEQLKDYIEHFHDPEPEIDWKEFCEREAELEAKYNERDREYYTSSTNRDFGPSNPWDAPGMSIRDFI